MSAAAIVETNLRITAGRAIMTNAASVSGTLECVCVCVCVCVYVCMYLCMYVCVCLICVFVNILGLLPLVFDFQLAVCKSSSLREQ